MYGTYVSMYTYRDVYISRYNVRSSSRAPLKDTLLVAGGRCVCMYGTYVSMYTYTDVYISRYNVRSSSRAPLSNDLARPGILTPYIPEGVLHGVEEHIEFAHSIRPFNRFYFFPIHILTPYIPEGAARGVGKRIEVCRASEHPIYSYMYIDAPKCAVLQCVAVCCSMLQCVAACCSVL